MNFDIDSRTIYKCIHGSHAYGTNIEGSDIDEKGICVPPKDVFLGFDCEFEQCERMVNKGYERDSTIYSIVKFAKLAVDCNPNIIEVLFVDDSDILYIDKWGECLRSLRDEFISKRVKYTFLGYSFSQIKRIKTHRKWLLDPPKVEPTRKDFGLPETMKISKGDIGAYDSLLENNNQIELPHDVVQLFCREKQYQQAKTYWDQYQNWKATRNQKRAVLEAKYGYDTKHGAHVVRLLRMCKEILESGKVIVKRHDAQELISIRNGTWSYDQLAEYSENIQKECDKLYVTSSIRHSPDRKKINKEIVSLVDDYLLENG